MSQLQNAYQKVVDKVQSWIEDFITMLPNIFVAIIVILVFYFVARILRKFLSRALSNFSKNEAVNKLLVSVIYVSFILIGTFLALGILNLDKTVTSLLAGLGIVGLALGFAFRDVAANFLSGIYMAIKSPINEGDIISYEDAYGTVTNIGLRATTITTLQGQDVVIPNRLIIENIYTHFTVNGHRRIDLDIGISYGDDLQKAERITLEAINSLDFLKDDKPVDLYYKEFGNSSINFVIRYWVDFTKETDYLKALSEGIKSIKTAYDKNDITITFPIRTLDFGMKGGKTFADMLDEAGVKFQKPD